MNLDASFTFRVAQAMRLHSKWLEGTADEEVNLLMLVKGQERYIFLYDDARAVETLRMLGRHASNKELTFNWYDAAVLSQRVRAQEKAAQRAGGRLRGRA